MPRLALSDPRWSDLQCRNYSAKHVPGAIQALLQAPREVKRFNDLYPDLCSEDTAWSAAYATAPYVADIAASLPPSESARVEYIFFLGYLRYSEITEEIPADLLDTYREALSRGLVMACETLQVIQPNQSDLMALLAAVASLKNFTRESELLFNPICGECGHELISGA